MSQLFIGDCREVMRTLIADAVKVQSCVTSPPYWGLRDYGVAGQLGLEPTIEEYVANMVEVFGLVRELLVDDGTLWLNLGDSYAGSRTGEQGSTGQMADREVSKHRGNIGVTKTGNGLKPKDLCGIPWRVAFELQADGWWLRQDIIWSKPNPMPESVTDRCTKAHEYLFLLAKSERYYFDQEAIAEPRVGNGDAGVSGWAFGDTPHDAISHNRQKGDAKTFRGGQYVDGNKFNNSHATERDSTGNKASEKEKRNRRSVWHIATQPYAEAHFATFPPALIEPCILAGSRPGDIVFDPFFGSGTTGEVAQRLGRQWLGIELSPAYAKLAEHRTSGTVGMAL